MLARKPRMLVAVALANRMARIAWALMTKNEILPRTAADRLKRQEAVDTASSRNASRSNDGTGTRSTRRGRENQLLDDVPSEHASSDFGPDPRISIQARGA